MKARHITAGAALALATVLGPLGPAWADPVNAKKGEVLAINCEVNGALTVAVNGNGNFTPGHVTTSNMVGMPYEVHIAGSFTPADGGATETFNDDVVKRAPHNGRLDTCTFHEEGSDQYGSFVFDGVVKISYTKG
jgi:hypothetical protein